jgi:uncharacterized protein YhhL (DUF1145 family)
MSNIHTSLKVSTNIIFIFLWGTIALILLFYNYPHSNFIFIISAILGVIGGIMQNLGFNESKSSFLEARTMFEVRRKLKETKWGKRYLKFLWISNLFLLIIVLRYGYRPVLDIAMCYFSMMFTREIVTLKSTFELRILAKQENITC